MRRLALWRAMGVPFLIVVAVAAVVTHGGTSYFVITMTAAVALIVGNVVALRRAREPLAAALSQHLGLPISAKHLPPLRSPQMFDQAVANMRDGRPMNTHQRSFFGGFIRIERP
jgi:hypothetical protein